MASRDYDGPLVSQRAKASAVGADNWAEELVFTELLGPEARDPVKGALPTASDLGGHVTPSGLLQGYRAVTVR